MPDQDPQKYESWLQGFESEVAAAMGAGGGRSKVTQAVSEFEDWWRGEHGSGEDPEGPISAEVLDKELALARKETALLKEEIAQLKSDPDGAHSADLRKKLESLGNERQELLEKIRQQGDEIQGMRATQARTQSTYAEMRVKMSRAKDEYEGQINRLEDKARMLVEQITALNETKAFLQREFDARGHKLDTERDECEEARARAAAAERIRMELAGTVKDLEKELAASREKQAGLSSQVSELREQASMLQDKLVRNADHVDHKIAESKREFERGGGGEAAKEMTERQEAAEARVLDAVRFLETKVREIQLDSKERFEEFRDLMETLSRFRKNT
jgi:chromosome segregation ATPase